MKNVEPTTFSTLWKILKLKHIKFFFTYPHSGWDLAEYTVVRASDCQRQSRNSSGLDPSILWQNGIWGAADEAVLNKVHTKDTPKNPPC